MSSAKAGLLSQCKLVQGMIAEILAVDAFNRVLPSVLVEGTWLSCNARRSATRCFGGCG